MQKGITKNLIEKIQEILLCFRWTSWGIESALTDNDALIKFKNRANFDYIILLDDGSYEGDIKPGNCLMGLKQAIFTVK